MTWLGAMIAVAVAIALIALSGGTVKGARPVGNTRLMTAARVVLAILAGVAVYAAWPR